MNFLTKDGLLKLWTIIKQYVADAIVNKVDKEDGKGLSTNDYTTAEKEKLAGVAEGANKTVVVDGLESTSAEEALSANQGRVLDEKIDALADSIGEAGYGDMMKSVYDTDGNGQVDKADDADKLGGVVAANYALKTDLPTDFYGKEEVDAKVKAVQDVVDANAEDISGLDGRVEVLEGKAHEHGNKAVLDGITAEKVSAWDGAEQNAKDYADGLNEAMDGRVETLENAGYQNASQVNSAISEAVKDFATDSEVASAISTATTDMATNAGVDSKIATAIADMATDTELATAVSGVEAKIPTNNNQLTNGAGYQTAANVESAIVAKGYQTSAQVQSAINEAVGEITSFEYQVVDALPDAGEKGVVYLVPNGGSGNNIKDEYIWIETSSVFEKIGTTEIDLDPYVLETDLVAITDAEIEAICV